MSAQRVRQALAAAATMALALTGLSIAPHARGATVETSFPSGGPLATAALAGLALPPGFELVDYPTGQAPLNLTNFAWLDDGGLLASGKDGTITFVPPGGQPHVLATVPSVRALGDHGFLGFAPANDYTTTGRVYVTYDRRTPAGTGFGMVEEWKASPPGRPVGFTRVRTLVDGGLTSPQLSQLGSTHGIDTVLVAPDDTVFVSIGDDAANNGDPRTLRAQDLTQPFGKLLHLTPDGRGVPSNPFYAATAPTSWRSRIYAYGFRNPFRFTLDPRSGVPHLGDVGWATTEEVDTLTPGANAGWPCYEGMARTTFASYGVCRALYAAGSARMPILTYPHAGHGASVVGGVHYTGTTYPPLYRSSFFYGDYTRQELWTLATDTAGRLTRRPESAGFATGAGGPVAFHAGPNGDITYADILGGRVRRLVFTAGNRPPAARLTTVTDAATRQVTFSAADSFDLDGDGMTYQWDFGDGTSAAAQRVTHGYATGDPAQVTLTVRDTLGAAGTATATVYPANNTPQLTLTAPSPRTYSVGDPVQLSASATDPEDGALAVSWDTALLHCPFAGSCHLHPDGTVTGPTYSQPFTDHGSDTTMLVTARATDSHGATATTTFEAKPTLRTLAVNSPVAVAINGVVASSAQVVAGSAVQLGAPLGSSYWQFTGWSDGRAATHSLVMPNADVTLSARYRTAIDARYSAPGIASSLGRPTTAEYDVAGGRARNFTAGRLFWSAATGARSVRGPVLVRYLAGGGPAAFGFPTADQVHVPGGDASYFTKARIYWSSGTGAHWVQGALLAKYLAAGGPARYGLPTTDNSKVTGGYYVHFTGGRSIFWSARTGSHLVYGAIRRKYASMGFQRSCLGFPTTDEYAIPGGRRNRFVGGAITYRSSNHATTSSC